jgi:hypothetical protein
MRLSLGVYNEHRRGSQVVTYGTAQMPLRKRRQFLLYLLSISSIAGSPMSDVHAGAESGAMLDRLKEKARQRGRVRVIVTVRAAPAESDATKAREPMQNQAAIVKAMRDAGAIYAAPIAGTALVVMELTEHELDKVMSTGYVESIAEDRTSAPQ